MIGLKHVISTHDPPNQILGLVLLDLLALQLSDQVLQDYLTLVQVLTTHKDPGLRRQSFVLFQNCMKRDSLPIRNLCKSRLLAGLSDSNTSIQENIRQFFTTRNNLPVDSCERLKAVLLNMYVPDHESALIRYAPYSILVLSQDTPGFNKKIYTDPLDNCRFQEQVVNTSWRQQHAGSLLPMFADTLASQSQAATAAGSQSQTCLLYTSPSPRD